MSEFTVTYERSCTETAKRKFTADTPEEAYAAAKQFLDHGDDEEIDNMRWDVGDAHDDMDIGSIADPAGADVMKEGEDAYWQKVWRKQEARDTLNSQDSPDSIS